MFLLAAAGLLLATAGLVRAHTVPNLTVEAHFASDGAYSLVINIDPRTFMAADPTAFPPVPASWYLDQTREQTAATHQKAREYLGRCLGLTFSGSKTPLPECQFQAINGADNTPVDASTQEVHLLATARGRVPKNASVLQIDYAKEATTPLILLSSHEGRPAPRAQVAFPGEGKQVRLLGGPPPPAQDRPVPPPLQTAGQEQPRLEKPQAAKARPPARPQQAGTAAAPPQPAPQNRVWLVLVIAVTLICLIVGWRLLARYRHHHRFHAKPRTM